jgi:uncharacterized protein YqjF (DUF2071 family)
MYQTWTWLSFLHWSYDPETVQRLLPDGLRVHAFEGRAWVGLTPFLMEDLRTPVAPALPWFTSFPETNVRTYVRGPDGREGLWFLSLDAGRLEPVLVARSTYALPYMWSRMAAERDGRVMRYRSERRWPGPTPAASRITVEIGAPLAPEDLTERDHYLTARWQLYTRIGFKALLARSVVDHGPWPLHRATVRELDQTLLTAGGLPAPEGEPVVHWSPGVRTRISGPRVLGRVRRGVGTVGRR